RSPAPRDPRGAALGLARLLRRDGLGLAREGRAGARVVSPQNAGGSEPVDPHCGGGTASGPHSTAQRYVHCFAGLASPASLEPSHSCTGRRREAPSAIGLFYGASGVTDPRASDRYVSPCARACVVLSLRRREP